MPEVDPPAASDGRGGIPRYRVTSLPALFSQGFRPFFLAAACAAPILLLIWLIELAGANVLATGFGGASWHAHEMIFGFATAAMAGFLMTAIPNWTGRMPLQGFTLLLLVVIWLIGRIAVATSAVIGPAPAMLVDLSFLILLMVFMGREILMGGNWRNLPMIATLAVLIAANAAMHLAAAGYGVDPVVGYRAGLSVFSVLIVLVGGKLIPSFTGNALAKLGRSRPPTPGTIDRLSIALVPVALLAWIFKEMAPALQHVAGTLLVIAGGLGGVRLVRWRGLATRRDLLLLMLHAGFAWLCIGLVLLGLGNLWPAIPELAGLHAIGAGAMGTMILAVMTRTTMAHTGRRGITGKVIPIMCGAITAAGLLRVLAAFLPEAAGLLMLSAAAWTIAFGTFLFRCGWWLLATTGAR